MLFSLENRNVRSYTGREEGSENEAEFKCVDFTALTDLTDVFLGSLQETRTVQSIIHQVYKSLKQTSALTDYYTCSYIAI